ncbi:phytase [Halioxenophilus sp. WMMB6]|uniref:phytase n=1 Tax=Halioxenophilus sp. WMMB6 TaxID=3073815 RepID=UPI00295E2E7C|nr:phytase [Halioxenophilus sp. WMMB6]
MNSKRTHQSGQLRIGILSIKAVAALVIGASLHACGGNLQSTAGAGNEALTWQPSAVATASLDRLVLASSGLTLLAVSGQGLELRSGDQQVLDQLAGSFEQFDVRPLAPGRWLVAAVDDTAQRALAVVVSDQHFGQAVTLPTQEYALSNACLYQAAHANASADNYLFVVSEQGAGGQWLLGSGEQLLAEPLLVRSLPIPPSASFCQVDDAFGDLFVNEEAVGLWRFPAAAEAPSQRQPVAMVAPFGEIEGEVGNMRVVPGGLLLIDPKAAQLHPLQRQPQGWKHWPAKPLAEIADGQQLHATTADGGLALTVRDDDSGRWWQTQFAWPAPEVRAPAPLPVVRPAVETDTADQFGDAMDDPAVWINPAQPQQSLILATDKKRGLRVYGLDGHQRQLLDVGRLNNVDVRSGVKAGPHTLAIAAASHRDLNAISLFTIDAATRQVAHVADIATGLSEVYGFCLYQPDEDHLYAFINDKDGTYLQYRIDASHFTGTEVRRWQLSSQPEGCVADDRNRRLFIGEEDVGVWVLAAEPDAPLALQPVIKVGGLLHDDVEGLGLYHHADGSSQLVISSQGNDSYVVVNAEAPYQAAGAFRIAAAAGQGFDQQGIDGVSETDGLEVVAANLGGIWSQGMLVVQDGRNRMPETRQNLKLVPWSQVQALLAPAASVAAQ